MDKDKFDLTALEIKLAVASKVEQRIQILSSLAYLMVDVDLERAYSMIEKLQELSTSGKFANTPHSSGLGWSKVGFGWYYLRSSKHDLALHYFKDAEDILADNRLIKGKKEAINGQGIVYMQLGIFDRALEAFLTALKLEDEPSDSSLRAGVLNNLGVIYIELNDLEQAYDYLQRSLKASSALGNKRTRAAALDNLSNIYYRQRKYQMALDCALESLTLSREIESKIFEAESLNSVGDAFEGLEDETQALAYYQAALKLSTEIGHTYERVESLVRIADLHLKNSDFEPAAALLPIALDLAQESGAKRLEYQCYQAFATLYEKQGKYDQALVYFKRYHDTEKKVFNQLSDWRLNSLRVTHQAEIDENLRGSNAYLEDRFLKIKESQNQLTEQVIRDHLTGLYNRRYLDLIENELFDQGEFEKPFSMILLDIDLFKKINDHYGHLAGDEILIVLSKLLVEIIRTTDIIFRFGGDEFAIILPDTSTKEALIYCKDWHKIVKNTTFGYKNQAIQLTLSMGIAGFPENALSFTELYSAADEALYVSKKHRDKISVSSHTPHE